MEHTTQIQTIPKCISRETKMTNFSRQCPILFLIPDSFLNRFCLFCNLMWRSFSSEIIRHNSLLLFQCSAIFSRLFTTNCANHSNVRITYYLQNGITRYVLHYLLPSFNILFISSFPSFHSRHNLTTAISSQPNLGLP